MPAAYQNGALTSSPEGTAPGPAPHSERANATASRPRQTGPVGSGRSAMPSAAASRPSVRPRSKASCSAYR